jgi:hypothetical protein
MGNANISNIGQNRTPLPNCYKKVAKCPISGLTFLTNYG